MLDRTGSMANIWAETVQSVNAYVGDLQKTNPDDLMTLAVFDYQNGLQFDVVRHKVRLADWTPMAETEVSPRGWTPLYDALVRVIAMAEASKDPRTVVIVMTDGHENASREVRREDAKAAVDRFLARGWQMVFLGANFDAFDDAKAVGVMAAATMSTSPGHFVQVMHATARSTSHYGVTGQSMTYSAVDREEAGEEEITGGKGSGSGDGS